MTATPLPNSTPAAAPAPNRLRTLRNLILSQEGILLIVIIVVMVVVGASKPRFRAENNLLDIFQSEAYIAVAAVGMSILIISGNIDISVGSLVGVLAILSATLSVNGLPGWLCWLIPIGVSMIIGAINGFLVAYLRIPSIVVTLGMLSILKGGMIIILGGTTIINMQPDFFLSQWDWLNIPTPIWLMIFATIIGALWMRYSSTGRSIYAVGGNAEAARLSGINTRRITITAFVINGLCVGICAIMYATQLNSLQASPPVGLELRVITASVVGGVSILGGIGTVVGSTLAAILLSVIRSAMIFIDIPASWINAVRGSLILVTVLVDILRHRQMDRH
ncbi:MAG: ABC transporter permease [Chloroflexi bacterium]|nr:ABC transporter permease [Chloroflexota bacterium]MCC6895336.1 ABC transporter permease [Anaerolineae bacterium]